RRNCEVTSDQAASITPECGNGPDFVAAQGTSVIDFRAVSGKAIHYLLAFVVGELERLTAGRKHYENLRYASNWRIKSNGASVWRKMSIVNRLVPMAYLGDFRLNWRSGRVRKKVIQAINGRDDEKQNDCEEGSESRFVLLDDSDDGTAGLMRCC